MLNDCPELIKKYIHNNIQQRGVNWSQHVDCQKPRCPYGMTHTEGGEGERDWTEYKMDKKLGNYMKERKREVANEREV